jgi:transketolase
MKTLPFTNSLHGNPTQNPQFNQVIKDRSGEEVTLACPKSTRALVALMDMQAVLGGAASHFGGPAAFAEMMSATHGYMFLQAQKKSKTWHELFHFINDAGHCENGIYALKANYGVAGLSLNSLKGFRSIESQLTGHGEAHLFPESVYISNGPLGSGLPQAQGLGAAESMSSNPRLTITAISDGACMEGEAKEAFAAIPGLAHKGKMGPMLCMISDNNTKLSGRIDEDSFSMKPTFESLQALGWEVTYVEDGHDLEKVYQEIETASDKAMANSKKPQLLWFKTIKGKGVAKTEQSASGGHGFPLKKADELSAFVKEIYDGGDVPQEISSWTSEIEKYEKPKSPFEILPGDRVKIQKGVSDAFIKKFKDGLPVVSVSADLQGSTGMAGFRKECPEAAFEVGVAESNMVNMAVGLSKQGYIPVVDTFAQFGVTKGALPLTMSGLSQAPIIGIYSHTGFQDAADGASHQAISYMAMVSSIPNVDVVSLSSSDEAFALVGQAVDQFAADRKAGKVPRSTIFFLGRETFLTTYNESAKYELGKAQVISDNTDQFDKSVTLLGVGSLLENTIHAQAHLAKKGVGSIVVNPSMMNYPDTKTIESFLKKTGGKLVTVEDHRVLCGFGAMLAHDLSQKNTKESFAQQWKFHSPKVRSLSLCQKTLILKM